MTLSKRQQSQMQKLLRENEMLKAALTAAAPPGPTWWEPVVGGGRAYLPAHARVVFHGLQVRAEDEPGVVDLNAEYSMLIRPLASNHATVLAPTFIRVKRGAS